MAQPKNEINRTDLLHEIGITVGGPVDPDVSGQASSRLCSISEGLLVSALSKPLSSGAVGYSDQDMRTQHPVLDNGLVCGMTAFGTGLTGTTPVAILKSLWQSSGLLEPRITAGAIPSVDACMPGQASKQPPMPTQRTMAEVYKPGYMQCYTPRQYGMYKPLHGEPYPEKGYKWQDSTNMLTAGASYLQGIMGLIQGLLGSLGGGLSLKNTFNNLSNSQIQQIQSSTTPEIFATIQAHMNTTVDIGDAAGRPGAVPLSGRVHPQVIANNMVALFCNCKSYVDVTAAMQKLKTDPILQGKNQIPTAVFTANSMYGTNTITVDGYGKVTLNVSPQAANSESLFTSYMTGSLPTIQTSSIFLGSVSGNTLTVSSIISGNISTGTGNILQGFGIPGNTHIISYNTGKGAQGTYFLDQAAVTPSNTYLTLTYVKPGANGVAPGSNTQNSATGGGGGGFMPIGMFPGVNFFGEAAQLIQEMIKTINPIAGAALMGTIMGKGSTPMTVQNIQTGKGIPPTPIPAPGFPAIVPGLPGTQSGVGLSAISVSPFMG